MFYFTDKSLLMLIKKNHKSILSFYYKVVKCKCKCITLGRYFVYQLIPQQRRELLVHMGSHSVTCHPHVSPKSECAEPYYIPVVKLVLIYRPVKDERLSWPEQCE